MKALLPLFISLALSSCRQPVDDTAAIKHLLEKESATWRAGDVPGHAACWHIQPYSRILVSTGDGQALDIPPAAMLTSSSSMGQGGAAVNTNYKLHVAGTTAWVSHDEESTAKDGKKTYSYELRLLEKIDDQWKLVGQSIHIRKR
ncbi:endo-arabinase [Hymenobacter sp. BRD128]|uniref:endo-arabinase n=1 Tax=Hymenobacter sp. BRD128 TaxID=2675878 RepID=UPI0015669A5E|nr:endo-arabinase [Hymenobacter sp. BRD128]QKG55592.1 endo-arabinase [Hymenobacter sp. BRD128]